MEEVLNKILQRVRDMFMRYGMKSVTMDDVARELGMSKKTLYKHVDSKKDLVHKVIEWQILEDEREIEAALKVGADAIEQMFNISIYINKKLQQLNPSAVFDLQKYYPESWERLHDYNFNFNYKIIKENIERGEKEGLYQNDLDADILAKFYVARMNWLFDPEVFPYPKYKSAQLHREYILYHLRSLVTSEGSEVLNKHLKAQNELG